MDARTCCSRTPHRRADHILLPPPSACVADVLLACGLGLQLCVVMGCLALTGRFAEFMDLRVQKQQLLNKDLCASLPAHPTNPSPPSITRPPLPDSFPSPVLDCARAGGVQPSR